MSAAQHLLSAAAAACSGVRLIRRCFINQAQRLAQSLSTYSAVARLIDNGRTSYSSRQCVRFLPAAKRAVLWTALAAANTVVLVWTHEFRSRLLLCDTVGVWAEESAWCRPGSATDVWKARHSASEVVQLSRSGHMISRMVSYTVMTCFSNDPCRHRALSSTQTPTGRHHRRSHVDIYLLSNQLPATGYQVSSR